MISAPCKGCTREWKCVGCHSKCQEYIDFDKANKELKAKIKKEKETRYGRRPYVSDEQFRNAGKRINKVFRQHMK